MPPVQKDLKVIGLERVILVHAVETRDANCCAGCELQIGTLGFDACSDRSLYLGWLRTWSSVETRAGWDRAVGCSTKDGRRPSASAIP